MNFCSKMIQNSWVILVFLLGDPLYSMCVDDDKFDFFGGEIGILV